MINLILFPHLSKKCVCWLLCTLPKWKLPAKYILSWLHDSLSRYFLLKSLGKIQAWKTAPASRCYNTYNLLAMLSIEVPNSLDNSGFILGTLILLKLRDEAEFVFLLCSHWPEFAKSSFMVISTFLINILGDLQLLSCIWMQSDQTSVLITKAKYWILLHLISTYNEWHIYHQVNKKQ